MCAVLRGYRVPVVCPRALTVAEDLGYVIVVACVYLWWMHLVDPAHTGPISQGDSGDSLAKRNGPSPVCDDSPHTADSYNTYRPALRPIVLSTRLQLPY